MKYCEAGRDSPNHVKYAHLFFKASLCFRIELHWNPKFLINCDEIRFQEARDGSHFKLITSRDGTRPPINRPKASRGMTVIPFVAADGTTVLVVYIFPFLSKKKNSSRQSFFHFSERYSKRGSVLNRAYVWTAKGWLTLDVWEKIIRLFIKKTKSYFNGQVGILVMDRLASHINAQLLSMMIKSRIRSVFIPTKSSHFLQPLDNLIFAKWKNFFRKLLTMIDLRPNNNGRPKVALEEVVMSTESVAFDSKTIVSSFKNTGIYPLDWELIKSNAEKAENRKFSKGNQLEIEEIKKDECMKIIKKSVDVHFEDVSKLTQQKEAKKRRMTVEKNKLMTDVELIAFFEKKQNLKKEKEEEKRLKVERRKMRKTIKKTKQRNPRIYLTYNRALKKGRKIKLKQTLQLQPFWSFDK